ISEGAYLGWQAVAIQRIPRHWSDKISTTSLQHRMKCRRMRHLSLQEFRFVFGGCDVETGRRDDPASVHRVLVGVPQGDKLIIAGDIGEREARHPAQCLYR